MRCTYIHSGIQTHKNVNKKINWKLHNMKKETKNNIKQNSQSNIDLHLKSSKKRERNNKGYKMY